MFSQRRGSLNYRTVLTSFWRLLNADVRAICARRQASSIVLELAIKLDSMADRFCIRETRVRSQCLRSLDLLPHQTHHDSMAHGIHSICDIIQVGLHVLPQSLQSLGVLIPDIRSSLFSTILGLSKSIPGRRRLRTRD